MDAAWWNELSIRRVERGETDRLDLVDDFMLKRLPRRVWSLDTVRDLMIRGCTDLRLPPTRLGLTGLRRIGWFRQRGATLPGWALGLELGLDWSTWRSIRNHIDPSRLTGLAIGPRDQVDPQIVPSRPLHRLEFWDLTDGTRIDTLVWLLNQHAPHLEHLTIVGCTVWPKAIAKCTRLRTLSVTESPLTRFPEGIEGLKRLEGLTWLRGKLAALPPLSRMWPRLQQLTLGWNQLRMLPDDLGRLPHLQELGIWHNPLSGLPRSLASHANLEALNAHETPLEQLPGWLFRLPRLQVLSVGRQPGAVGDRDWTLPPSILDSNRFRVRIRHGGRRSINRHEREDRLAA